MQKSLPKRCHNVKTRERESSSRLICHIEHSEISLAESNRDISVCAKPQYDKANAGRYDNVASIAKGSKQISSPSRSTSEARGG